ncbi:MAG: hypothetical protein SV760_06420, partial [Halobacteria archaeon]|nr:hypothetical protein [Halobacteria archaeon]
MEHAETGSSAISDSETLTRLLQIGVVIEEYAEEKASYMLPRVDPSTRDYLDESRSTSQSHRDRLIETVDEVSDDGIDEEHVEERVREAIESSVEAEDEEDALREQLRSEELAYSFYDTLVEACQTSDLDVDDEELEH